MRIGLISDTHIARPEEAPPAEVKKAFQGVELILHAGDVWIPSVLNELETIAPVIAAWGDDDIPQELGDDSRMISEKELKITGITLWLMHQKPAYGHVVPRENRVFARDLREKWEVPDVVVYGHTHKALIEYYRGVLIINPGSPTWPNNIPELGTVGILTIESGKTEALIVSLR
jgi:putative phosphoesterase